MRISVVIPTWNRAGLVVEAIRSALDQSLTAREVIVVDDGSTDDTAARVRELGPGVRLIAQANAGAAAARNRGLEEAAGDWIAFLDSDDLWEPTKLEKQAALAATSPDAAIVYCDSRAIDREGRPLAGHGRTLREGDLTAALFEHVLVHTPAVLARRDLLRRLGGFDAGLRVCEDYDLWLRASLETPFLLVPEPLFLRRVHPDSLAHEDDPAHAALKCRVLERFAGDPRARAKLPPALVRRRLARVHSKAARAWIRHRDPARAQEHLARVLALEPWNLRARWLRVRAAAMPPAAATP